MTDEADEREAESPNEVKQDPPSFFGHFLRFAGMTIIVAAIVLTVFFWGEPVVFLVLLAIGSAGAAMHYKGRQLAPGKPGASIMGGILGGLASSAALIVLMLFVAAMFLDACRAFFKL